MIKRFFTSDLHLFHKNILKYENENRKFKNIYEMNDKIIENWNKKIDKNDEIYILGDISFGKLGETINILKKLNGKKFLIKGNHDQNLLKSEDFRNQFIWIEDYKSLHFDNFNIILFHYPILEWDGFFKNSIHLYGHVHSNQNPKSIQKNSFNVGLDVNNFEPIEFKEIFKKIKSKLNKIGLIIHRICRRVKEIYMKYLIVEDDVFYTLDMRKFKKGEEFLIKGTDVIDHNGKWLCNVYSKFAQHLGKIIKK